MARTLLLLALCVLPALVSASRSLLESQNGKFFEVQGKVYCDYCKFGFENTATKYMPGATVKVACVDRSTMKEIYSKEGVTDATGTYNIVVAEQPGNAICTASLVQSSEERCSSQQPGRNGARVILSSSNGIASNTRFANAMGYEPETAQDGCAEVAKLYDLEDNSI